MFFVQFNVWSQPVRLDMVPVPLPVVGLARNGWWRGQEENYEMGNLVNCGGKRTTDMPIEAPNPKISKLIFEQATAQML